MRVARVLVLLLAATACKGSQGTKPQVGTDDKPIVAGGRAAGVVMPLPRVQAVETTAIVNGAPPVLVLVDERGNTTVAAGPPTWDELAAFDARRDAKTLPADHTLDVFVRGIVTCKQTARWGIEHIGKSLRLDECDFNPGSSGVGGAPPPPPSPGSTRDPAEVERDRRKERADAVSGYGPRMMLPPSPSEPQPALPSRIADVVGEVVEDRRVAVPQYALVLAHPGAPASALVRVLNDTEGLIGVEYAGRVLPLRVQFLRAGRDDYGAWVEVTVKGETLVVEAPPGNPRVVAWGKPDVAALAAALTEVRETKKLSPSVPVDLLLEPESDVQRLVDLVVSLDNAGVRTVGLGERLASDDREAALRGRRIPRVEPLQLWVGRGLYERIHRQSAFDACYEEARKRNPELAGQFGVAFQIEASGELRDLKLERSIEPELDGCLLDAIKQFRLPPQPATASKIELSFDPG